MGILWCLNSQLKYLPYFTSLMCNVMASCNTLSLISVPFVSCYFNILLTLILFLRCLLCHISYIIINVSASLFFIQICIIVGKQMTSISMLPLQFSAEMELYFLSLEEIEWLWWAPGTQPGSTHHKN